MSANYQDEKEQRAKEESILEFASKVKELGVEIQELTEKQNVLKEEIRGLFKEIEVRELKNKYVDVKIVYPKTFDSGLLGVEYPELYERYTSIERVINEKVVVNKKDLKRFYPEAYEKCEIELTPRLTIQ